jgi:hypothetical protein
MSSELSEPDSSRSVDLSEAVVLSVSFEAILVALEYGPGRMMCATVSLFCQLTGRALT